MTQAHNSDMALQTWGGLTGTKTVRTGAGLRFLVDTLEAAKTAFRELDNAMERMRERRIARDHAHRMSRHTLRDIGVTRAGALVAPTPAADGGLD